jgi:hypothetical protein
MPDDTTDTAAVSDASAEAAFGSGYDAGADTKPDKSDTKPPANGKADDPARDAARTEAESPPEVVSITKKEWDEIRGRTSSYDHQLSKAFGTIGQLQRVVNGLQMQQTQAQPAAARKVEISREAFKEMERDFPELAAQTRAALEAALSGLPANGGAEIEAAKLESMMATYTARREVEALEDAYPEWRTIVGAVDVSREQPDANNPFRKWLGTKDTAYQARINGSESAAVIGRAIRLFQRETAAAPGKPAATPRDTARGDRIRAAIQPRGDNAGAAPANTSEDAFAAGFGR